MLCHMKMKNEYMVQFWRMLPNTRFCLNFRLWYFLTFFPCLTLSTILPFSVKFSLGENLSWEKYERQHLSEMDLFVTQRGESCKAIIWKEGRRVFLGQCNYMVIKEVFLLWQLPYLVHLSLQYTTPVLGAYLGLGGTGGHNGALRPKMWRFHD